MEMDKEKIISIRKVLAVLILSFAFSMQANAMLYMMFIKRHKEKQLRLDSIDAEQGNVSKQLSCAVSYCKKRKYSTARYFLEKAMTAGSDTAYCYLAEMDYFKLGVNTPDDGIYAVWYIRVAASKGCQLSNWLQGVIAYDSEKYSEAVDFFRKVPDNCIYTRLTKYYLAKCYYYGRGVPKDVEMADTLLKESVCEGDFWCHRNYPRYDEETKSSRLVRLLLDINQAPTEHAPTFGLG